MKKVVSRMARKAREEKSPLRAWGALREHNYYSGNLWQDTR